MQSKGVCRKIPFQAIWMKNADLLTVGVDVLNGFICIEFFSGFAL